jgi:rhodanese-related sulfurtransferase
MPRAQEKIPDLNAEIIIICAGGMRSLKAAEVMQIMGYKNVFSLSDGVGALVSGYTTAARGVRRGFIESVGNTPLIRLNK